MSLRGSIFAAIYDRQIASTERAGLADRRKALLVPVRGQVLEIGGGTGANLRYYGQDVASLTVTDPEPAMVRRLRAHARDAAPGAEVLRVPAEDLPFGDATFDVAVSTLVLCGVSDQARALRQLLRVLRPGGQLVFIEHVRADDPKLARHQDRMNWLNRIMVGCDCNRRTLSAIEEAGFTVTQLEHGTLPKAPSFVQPLITGTAVREA